MTGCDRGCNPDSGRLGAHTQTLSAEARARGESLQEYLLDLLDREARDIDNRRLLAEWATGPLVAEACRSILC